MQKRCKFIFIQTISTKTTIDFSTRKTWEIRAKEPFKGVEQLINQDKIPEPLEKGLIRQNFGLSVFKDGTVRFDATNSPLHTSNYPG